MKSNWEESKKRSRYHFDPQHRDQAHEVITHLGHVDPGHWHNDIDEIVANSKPATWATRGYKGEGVQPPREDLQAEEYDLVQAGMAADTVITHLNWQLPLGLQLFADKFGLDDPCTEYMCSILVKYGTCTLTNCKNGALKILLVC